MGCTNPQDTAPEDTFRLKLRGKVQRESNTAKSVASNLLKKQISMILSMNWEARFLFLHEQPLH